MEYAGMVQHKDEESKTVDKSVIRKTPTFIKPTENKYRNLSKMVLTLIAYIDTGHHKQHISPTKRNRHKTRNA